MLAEEGHHRTNCPCRAGGPVSREVLRRGAHVDFVPLAALNPVSTAEIRAPITCDPTGDDSHPGSGSSCPRTLRRSGGRGRGVPLSGRNCSSVAAFAHPPPRQRSSSTSLSSSFSWVDKQGGRSRLGSAAAVSARAAAGALGVPRGERLSSTARSGLDGPNAWPSATATGCWPPTSGGGYSITSRPWSANPPMINSSAGAYLPPFRSCPPAPTADPNARSSSADGSGTGGGGVLWNNNSHVPL